MKCNYISMYVLLPVMLLFSSCEKVININLDEGIPQIAVDAFITDVAGKQTIKLTNTSPYFKNSLSPAIVGARVNIINENTGEVFPFPDINNNGNYTWSPTTTGKLARLNNEYSLVIVYKGDTITSRSYLNPVPPIDSLTYEYKKGISDKLTGYIASFWGVDFPNRKDYYWIKSFRNDTLLNDPKYINFALDAAFEGWNADGLPFFDFIRKAITPFDKPFRLNDSVRVELRSINEETYHFLVQTQFQLTNAGLFAQPPANLPTNIITTNKTSANKPVGWFEMSAISQMGVTIK